MIMVWNKTNYFCLYRLIFQIHCYLYYSICCDKIRFNNKASLALVERELRRGDGDGDDSRVREEERKKKKNRRRKIKNNIIATPLY